MEEKIIARENEKDILNRLYLSKKPEFLAIYGRRRVGKSFLISEYFENRGIFFELIGSKDSSEETEIARFGSEISYKFYHGRQKFDIDNWEAAFISLVQAVDEKISDNDFDGKIILFFDELPWIGRPKKTGNSDTFISTLSYYWNKFFSKSKYKQVLLIVCGSAASWMINNVINDKGGLHNRVTEIIRLEPFSVSETSAYLESMNVILEKKQIIDLYMVFGGVPAYLSRIERGRSTSETINKLCFEINGFLANEFNRLFQSLFENSYNHIAAIKALSVSHKGLSRAELAPAANLNAGGLLTTVLRELEESGFIIASPPWGKKKKGTIYSIADEYIVFYLKWIEPALKLSSAKNLRNYWSQQGNSASWHAWAGYAFERICIKHIDKIKQGLNILGVLSQESVWRYAPPKTNKKDKTQGSQIDLVINRADRTINLCEIKYCDKEYEITDEVKRNLENKKRLFKEITKTKSQLFITMITPYGVKKDERYHSIVDNQLTFDCLFNP
ncbi:MAG: ATP-binding protein [Fibrobacteria bacterium]|nr:ATP-binding protein [Fibrobacteria bacterium]